MVATPPRVYCYMEKRREGSKTKTLFISTHVNGGAGSVFPTLEKLAEEVDNVFWKNGRGCFIYDEMILYSCKTKDIDGAPHITATREYTGISGNALTQLKLLHEYMEKRRANLKIELDKKPKEL